MREKKVLVPFLLVALTLFISGGFILINKKDVQISTILASKSYSYLPQEAKEVIQKVYENTGEVIKTEKNKTNNEPYLNPKYIEYLELSEEEKEKVELIPDVYVLDYEVSKSYSATTLPSSYDLRNMDGKNYVSKVKDQGSLGVCWAFASVENAETLIMKQTGQSYSDIAPNFSVRQMDYATATDRLIKRFSNSLDCDPIDGCAFYPYKNEENGSRKLGTGGNFFTSSIVMSNGLSLMNETDFPWNEDIVTRWPKDVFDYDKSQYEVDSTIQLASINEDTASQEVIDSYVKEVKNYMMQYGGPYIGTLSPLSTCGFTNSDGTKAMKTDDCANDSKNESLGHAMQIIGWNDDYEYSYCDKGTTHTSTTNGTCSSGTLTTGKGAWILKNSWGEETEDGKAYKYVYLTYDSTRLAIGFITSISKMSTRTWNNNYHSNPWIDSSLSKGMASVSEQTKEFDIKNDKPEKIEKIKFVNATKNGKLNISIVVGDKEYNDIEAINTTEVGVYTVDLSSKNIIVDKDKFTVVLKGDTNSKFYNDSISVFTSNVDKTESVTTYSSIAYDPTKPLSNSNPLYTTKTYSTFTLETHLKNIPSNANLVYRIKKSDGTYKEEGAISTFRKHIINTTGEASFFEFEYAGKNTTNDPLVNGEKYTFEVVYNGTVVDSFPFKYGLTTSTIRLHANNGTDYYYETEERDLDTTSFYKMSELQTKEFYNDSYYITGWNTKPDGSGTNYKVSEYIDIYADMDLYAQWSTDKLKVRAYFDCKESGFCSEVDGTVESQVYNLEDKITLPTNEYTKEGYVFGNWYISYGNNYAEKKYEEETSNDVASSYVKYPVFNNSTLKVYANWIKEDNYYTVTFDANGGTGSMLPINLEKYSYGTNLSSNRLKKNMYTKEGYTFTGWNTEPDGSGTSYKEQGYIQSTTDVKLYAQWQEGNYKVTFKSNGGVGNDTFQSFLENTASKLNKNTFTKEGYTFVGWNTNPDGTGRNYTDEQSITLTSDLVLYAKWEINKYTITFKSNGGSGTMNPQEVSYNTPTNLNKNTFIKTGFKFAGWNTNPDGTGENYTNEQSVSLSSNLVLYAKWEQGNPYVIKEYNYDESNNYISNISINVTVDEYKKNIELLDGYTVEVDSNLIDNKNLLYTGSKTRIYKNNVLCAELTNIVSGDTNGDGKINYLDYVNVYNHIQKNKHPESSKKLLEKEYLLAADMSNDSKITYLDYVKIYSKIKELKGEAK